MARPARKYPTPKIQLRGKAYRIRWYAFEKWFEFSLGAVTKEEAQRICFMLGAASVRSELFMIANTVVKAANCRTGKKTKQ